MLELIRVEYFGKPPRTLQTWICSVRRPLASSLDTSPGSLAPQVSELGVANIRIRRRPERSVAEVRTTAGSLGAALTSAGATGTAPSPSRHPDLTMLSHALPVPGAPTTGPAPPHRWTDTTAGDPRDASHSTPPGHSPTGSSSSASNHSPSITTPPRMIGAVPLHARPSREIGNLGGS
jgi:hypothetical protein